MTDLEDLRKRYANHGTVTYYEAKVMPVPNQGDPSVLALCDEVEALRQTVRGCETCGGDGVMMVPAGYNEDEVGDLRPEVCAECHGTCVSSWGQAIDEAEALRAEVAALRVQVAQSAKARGVGEAEYLEAVHQLGAAIRERDEARAQVAAAPHVLREWPTTPLEGDHVWFCGDGLVLIGEFHWRDASFVTSRDVVYERRALKPGEFFVRVP